MSESKTPDNGTINYYNIYFDMTTFDNPKGIFIEEIIDTNNVYSYKIKPFGFIPDANNNIFIFDKKYSTKVESLERKMNMFKNLSTSELREILNSNKNE